MQSVNREIRNDVGTNPLTFRKHFEAKNGEGDKGAGRASYMPAPDKFYKKFR